MVDLTGVKFLGKKAGRKVAFESASLGLVLSDVPCETTVYVGAAVYMQASGVANNAVATSLATSNVIGIVEAKASSVLCSIRVIGVTGAIFSGLDVTKEYYLSDSVDGQLETFIPSTSGSIILKVGQPFSATEMLANKGQRTVRL